MLLHARNCCSFSIALVV